MKYKFNIWSNNVKSSFKPKFKKKTKITKKQNLSFNNKNSWLTFIW